VNRVSSLLRNWRCTCESRRVRSTALRQRNADCPTSAPGEHSGSIWVRFWTRSGANRRRQRLEASCEDRHGRGRQPKVTVTRGPKPTLDEVEALALVIARPGAPALLIDSQNKADGWVSIREAARSGHAFAVAVADDILALDVDTPEHAATAFALVADLETDGIPVVVVASGRPGHIHVLARLRGPDVRARVLTRARERGLSSRRTIRPPLSPHRRGLPVRLVQPQTVTEVLDHLRVASSPSCRLSPTMFALLRHGDRTGRYAKSGGGVDRSRVEAAIALAAVNVGWTYAQFRAAILDERNVAGEKARERYAAHPAAGETYMRDTFASAESRFRLSPPIADKADLLDLVARIREAAWADDWSGMAARSAFSVLMAHLAIVEKALEIEYRAGVRRLAGISGVGRTTVSSANSLLVGRGYLACVQKAGRRSREASVWRLLQPRATRKGRTVATPLGGCEENCPDCARLDGLGEDAFRWRGLGKAAWATWRRLCLHDGKSAGQVAEALRVSDSVARKHLNRLRDHGLAERVDGQWLRRGRDLADVASEAGVSGIGALQNLRHALEQLGHVGWLESEDAPDPSQHSGAVVSELGSPPRPGERNARPAAVEEDVARLNVQDVTDWLEAHGLRDLEFNSVLEITFRPEALPDGPPRGVG